MTGYHKPVLLKESVDGLEIRPGGIYVDVTYGGGGHSREILSRMQEGKLFAFDQDEDVAPHLIEDPRFYFIRHNFRFLKNFLRYYGVLEVDGILADLGVSGHDFDDAERGFSFRFDARLDMRMNRDVEKDAAWIINNYSEEELRSIFWTYGEVHNARSMVSKIVSERSLKPINTIGEFKEAIASCIPAAAERKYLAKVFQALRIEVNNELDVLKELLEQSFQVLKPGGRLVVITYHSLEDRLVKNFFKSGNFEGKVEKDFYGNVSSPFELVNRKVIIPNEDELQLNPRSRSAKLRIALKR
ncbi:MAG: 16S rRNA (cytosine(1402)-N(4))-methyltransferase RsmH [Bacteroidota bacterium]|nr:16S rRNA (cytosine(1402)-N(4))-methyltransferase RsmH [Bacteroidota bacterium]